MKKGCNISKNEPHDSYKKNCYQNFDRVEIFLSLVDLRWFKLNWVGLCWAELGSGYLSLVELSWVGLCLDEFRWIYMGWLGLSLYELDWVEVS